MEEDTETQYNENINTAQEERLHTREKENNKSKCEEDEILERSMEKSSKTTPQSAIVSTSYQSLAKTKVPYYWQLIFLTIFSLIRLLIGLLCTLTGPILLDLQHQTNSTTTQLSWMFIARAAGFIVGSLLSVFAFKSSFIPIMLFFIVFVGGSCLMIPMSYNIITLSAAYFFQTMGFNVFRTSSPALLFSVTHGDDRGPALQMVTVAFIIGSTLSPPIAAPFVTFDPDNIENNTLIQQNTTHHGQWLGWDINNQLLPLFIGVLVYTIVIALVTIVCVKISPIDFNVKDAKRADTKPTMARTVFIIAIATLLMTLGGANFTTAFHFITTYCVTTLHVSKSLGILANSIFSITVAIMAVLSIATIKYFGHTKNLYAIAIFMLATPPLLISGAVYSNFIVMCIGFFMLALATSFLLAPIFMWGAERTHHITMLSAWVQNGFTIAEISFPFLVGFTLDLYHHAFVCWIVGLCVIFIIVLIIGEAVLRRRQNTEHTGQLQ